MISASEVAPIIVTRGDVDLLPCLDAYSGFGFADGYVWNNGGGDEDLAVYGRYAAIEMVDAPIVLVQDDDVALSEAALNGLLASYEPGKIVANMPMEYRGRYTDSCLVGFGAIFDRDLPRIAWGELPMEIVGSEWFERTCDVVFTTLTAFTLVDLPFTYLPATRAPNRMYRTPGNSEERRRMLDLCRKVRDGS